MRKPRNLMKVTPRPMGDKAACRARKCQSSIPLRCAVLPVSRMSDKDLVRSHQPGRRATGSQGDRGHPGAVWQRNGKAQPILIFKAPMEVLEIRLKRNRISRALPIAVATRRRCQLVQQIQSASGEALAAPVNGVDGNPGANSVMNCRLDV